MLRQYRARVAAEKAKQEGAPGYTMMGHGHGVPGNTATSSTESSPPQELYMPPQPVIKQTDVYIPPPVPRAAPVNVPRPEPPQEQPAESFPQPPAHPDPAAYAHHARESQEMQVPPTPRSQTESEYYGRGTQEPAQPIYFRPEESFPSDSRGHEEPGPASSASSIYLMKAGQNPGGMPNGGKPTADQILQAKIEQSKWDLQGRGEAPVDHDKLDYRGWADKGRDMIFGRKKK